MRGGPDTLRLLGQRCAASGVRLGAIDHQGSAAAPPRPADLRHDARHADHAAPAVRLRHQHRPAPPADRRGRRPTRARDHAHHPVGARQHRLHALHPPAAQRGRGRRAAAERRGAVRRHHPGRLHAPAGARRARADADRRRRHRSRWRPPIRWPPRSPAIDQALARDLVGPLASLRGQAPTPSRSCCTAATIPRARRGSTSCPACWA